MAVRGSIELCLSCLLVSFELCAWNLGNKLVILDDEIEGLHDAWRGAIEWAASYAILYYVLRLVVS